jgi:hypothetical protein
LLKINEYKIRKFGKLWKTQRSTSVKLEESISFSETTSINIMQCSDTTLFHRISKEPYTIIWLKVWVDMRLVI